MWTRAELKGNAKGFLQKFFWKAFVVAIVIALVTAGGSSNGRNHNNQVASPTNTVNFEVPWTGIDSSSFNLQNGPQDFINKYAGGMMPMAWGLILGVSGLLLLMVTVFALGFKIFLGAPLEVGGRSFFYKGALSDEEANFGHLGMAFRNTHYMNIVWVMFYRGLLNFFFFLLLIIPGIIKHYAYRMVPYILADNPEINASRAIQLSEEMTRGQKFDMFILDLSFLGWYLLGVLAFGIGIYFVNPYVYATQAQLYITLKAEALRNGIYTPDELAWDKPYSTM